MSNDNIKPKRRDPPAAPPPILDPPNRGPVDATGKPKAERLLEDAKDLGDQEHGDLA